MPVAGFVIGSGFGTAIGQFSSYGAAAVLAGVGAWLILQPGDDDDEAGRVRLLESARGWAVIGLGLSISLDELAIGFGAGLLRLPLVILVVLIAAQGFVAAQAGLRLGSRLAEATREAAERVAGGLLIAAAALVVVEKLSGA